MDEPFTVSVLYVETFEFKKAMRFKEITIFFSFRVKLFKILEKRLQKETMFPFL